MPQTLLIRADASRRIGTGHVMRCLALAQAWRRNGGSAIFLSAETTAALERRLAEEGFETVRIPFPRGTREDAAKSAEIAATHNASWVVADGYNFGLHYQRDIRAAGLRLLLIDDYGHAGEYAADLVLDQNLGTAAALYAQREPHTRLLLGPRYALLREEFLPWQHYQRKISAIAHKVLISLGGSDPDNVSAQVVEASQDLSVEMRVVAGGSNPHFDFLSSVVRPPSSVIRDSANMPELMAWADLAVGASGTTSWELAFMGLPSLMLVLAENQRPVAAALENANVARRTNPKQLTVDLSHLLNDRELRSALSKQGRQLVDGFGSSRIATRISAAYLQLRRARAEDCRLIWEWANDPEARAVSISTEPIPWSAHQQWYASRVNSPFCLFYLATNGDESSPVGQIRYDITDATAVLSLSLAKKARGRGLGSALIWRGSERCFADSSVNLIRAYIKPSNQASIRAFFKAGFTDEGNAELSGNLMRQFVMRRECVQ